MDTKSVQCTKETPWDSSTTDRKQVHHKGAYEVGEQENGWPGGDIITMHCPNCGHEWTAELPQ